ncbi:MAG: hypothetical protein WC455_12135 [Dehalococcoidia bacterium]
MATYNGLLNTALSQFNICSFMCTGASAAASITCTGIKTTSTILFAFHLSTASNLATFAQIDLDTLTITATNTITCSGDTASDGVLVFWTDVTA